MVFRLEWSESREMILTENNSMTMFLIERLVWTNSVLIFYKFKFWHNRWGTLLKGRSKIHQILWEAEECSEIYRLLRSLASCFRPFVITLMWIEIWCIHSHSNRDACINSFRVNSPSYEYFPRILQFNWLSRFSDTNCEFGTRKILRPRSFLVVVWEDSLISGPSSVFQSRNATASIPIDDLIAMHSFHGLARFPVALSWRSLSMRFLSWLSVQMEEIYYSDAFAIISSRSERRYLYGD